MGEDKRATPPGSVGVMVGIAISVVLWGIIGLVMYLCR